MSTIFKACPLDSESHCFSAGSTPAPRCCGCARRARFVRVHRQPRPADEPDYDEIPRKALGLRSREGAPDRLPSSARRRGHHGPAVRSVSHLDRRTHVLQHDADRARRDRHAARHGDEGRRRPHLGRRQHLQGNDIERFYATGCSPIHRSRSTSPGSTRRSSTNSAAAPRCPSS